MTAKKRARTRRRRRARNPKRKRRRKARRRTKKHRRRNRNERSGSASRAWPRKPRRCLHNRVPLLGLFFEFWGKHCGLFDVLVSSVALTIPLPLAFNFGFENPPENLFIFVLTGHNPCKHKDQMGGVAAAQFDRLVGHPDAFFASRDVQCLAEESQLCCIYSS